MTHHLRGRADKAFAVEGKLFAMTPPADARWKLIVGGLNEHGEAVPMTYERLAAVMERWPTSSATPAGIAQLLSTSRQLWTSAWFHYELLVVSAVWSLLAVEAALRDYLDAGTKTPLKAVVARAARDDRLEPSWVDRLDAGRQLRNHLLHAQVQETWTLGMTEPVVASAHELVASLYP